VRQAIVILGFSTVKSLAISASVFDMFDSDRQTTFSREDFWMHSIGCACVCRLLGHREPGVDEETSFVVGLLHDIGKLVLDQYVPEEFDTIAGLARERGTSFLEAEAEVLVETNHAEIGAWVAEQWKLSEELTGAIRNHHDVSIIEDQATRHLAAICRFSNFICNKRKVGCSGDFDEPVMDSESWAALAMPKEDLPKLVETVNQELAKSGALLITATGI
jgi:putative nucleotidyltransferase with HDIG domain